MTHTFENQYGAFTVRSKGASLLQLCLSGTEVLHDFGTEAEQWSQGLFMFPFPVRMSTGTAFEFQGQQWSWPINDSKHQAALHGMTAEIDFELQPLRSGVACTWHYLGDQAYYPFPCSVEVRYELKEGSLVMSAIIANTGTQTLPFHAGWHPYFRAEGQMDLLPIPRARLRKNERSHPRELIAFDGFDWSQEVDGAFVYPQSPSLQIEGNRLTVQGLSEIVQIFRPANAKFIAIEPITGLGHPDYPWLEVAPGDQLKVSTTVSITPT